MPTPAARKIAIVPGHHRLSLGAFGVLPDGSPGEHEHPLMTALGKGIVKLLDGRVRAKLFEHKPVGSDGKIVSARSKRRASYHATTGRTIGKIHEWGADAVVELHFNSSPPTYQSEQGGRLITRPARAWSGAFGIHWPGSENGKGLARAAGSACADALGIRNLGTRGMMRSWAYAPLLILRDTHVPAVIVETHNGKRAEEHAACIEAVEQGGLAAALAEALAAEVSRWNG